MSDAPRPPELPPAADLAVERCLMLCNVALSLSDEYMAPALGDALAELLESPKGEFRAVPPAPTFAGLSAPTQHDGRHFGYITVSGRALAYTELDQFILEDIARLIGWLLYARAQQHAQRADVAQIAGHLSRQLQILDNLQECVITMDLAGYITSWNRGAEALFGYSGDEAVGQNVLFLYADSDEASDSDAELDTSFFEPGHREFEVRRRRKNGEVFWASLQLTRMVDERGEPSGLIGYFSDISERRASEEAERLHACIFELSDEGVMITDMTRTIVSINPAFCRMLGFERDELIGQPDTMFNSERHDAAFYDTLWATVRRGDNWQGEMWVRRKSGEIFPVGISMGSVRDRRGEVSHFFAICTDITERKRTEGRIHHMAYYDALTNLPNRSLFQRLLDQALQEVQRKKHHGAVLFIDLNRFKPINDTLGHAVGDLVLQEVAHRLRNALRGADVVARLGGDEFVIGLFDVTDLSQINIVARKLLEALDPPILIDGREMAVGGAIGISIFPQDGDDTETLLRLADIAMYRAKQTGPDTFEFYSTDMNQRSVERLALEAALRRAIDRNELLLYYQPKVSLTTGLIVGAEALVRWKHPERGMVPPGDFIPLAEETGLIVPISHWVLAEACSQARRWRDAGMPAMRIAVNLSARDFSPELPQRVMAALSEQGIDPEWLELEITEGMLMNRTERVIEMMAELQHLGITLSLDDFGTGYSSLSYLKRFPIHTLKIDRSFVINIPQDRDDCAIAGAIASMASQLGHQVIAEGVESPEQVAFLRLAGCDEIQGYLFSAPVPPERFAAMVSERKQLGV